MKFYINYKVVAIKPIALEKRALLIWGGTEEETKTHIANLDFPESKKHSWGLSTYGTFYRRNPIEKSKEFLWNNRFYLTLLVDFILILRIFFRLEPPEETVNSIPVKNNDSLSKIPVEPEAYAYGRLGPGEGSYGDLAACFYYFLILVGINTIVYNSKNSGSYTRLPPTIEPSIPEKITIDTLIGRLDPKTMTTHCNFGLFFIFDEYVDRLGPLILDFDSLCSDARELIDNWIVEGYITINGKKLYFPNLYIILKSKEGTHSLNSHRLTRYQLINLSPTKEVAIPLKMENRVLLPTMFRPDNTLFKPYLNLPKYNKHLDALNDIYKHLSLFNSYLSEENQGLENVSLYHKIMTTPLTSDVFSGVVGRTQILQTLEIRSQRPIKQLDITLLSDMLKSPTTGIGKSSLLTIYSQLLDDSSLQDSLIVSWDQFGPMMSYTKALSYSLAYKLLIAISLSIPISLILTRLINGYSKAISFYEFLDDLSGDPVDPRIPNDTENVKETLTQMLTTNLFLMSFLGVSLCLILTQLKKSKRYIRTHQKCIASNTQLLPKIDFTNQSIKPGKIARSRILSIENLDELTDPQQKQLIDVIKTNSLPLGEKKEPAKAIILATSNTRPKWFEQIPFNDKLEIPPSGDYQQTISELEFIQYCQRLLKTTVPWDNNAVNFFYSICIQPKNRQVLINRAWETDIIPRANNYAVEENKIITKTHLEKAFNDFFQLELPDGTMPNIWLLKLINGDKEVMPDQEIQKSMQGSSDRVIKISSV